MPYILKQLGTFDPKKRKEGEKVIPTIFEWEASKYIAPKKFIAQHEKRGKNKK